jgi:AraC-like DNA-binding protein
VTTAVPLEGLPDPVVGWESLAPRGYHGGVSRGALVELVAAAAPREGSNATALPQVRTIRVSGPRPRTPVIYEPCLVIVAQGRKTAYLAERALAYDSEQYLVLSVPLPVECEIEAVPGRPYLAVVIMLDPAMVREVVLQADDEWGTDEVQPVIEVSTLTPALRDTAVRLLRALADPSDTRVLGPLFIRELLYRVSRGPQGELLRALALGRAASRRIARVLDLIHARYDEELDVAALARAAHLGVSTFHHAFKAATSMSPLRYVKTVRLHQARSLMLHGELTAEEAGYRVGYRSPSHFSREFKRLFGRPPREELQRLRSSDDAVSIPRASLGQVGDGGA